MWLLPVLLACGAPPPAPSAPPLPLEAPWTAFSEVAAGATVRKQTAEKLVLAFPLDTSKDRVATSFVGRLKADGWDVPDGRSVGRGIVLWVAQKDGKELLFSVVPQPDRLEIHLDY